MAFPSTATEYYYRFHVTYKQYLNQCAVDVVAYAADIHCEKLASDDKTMTTFTRISDDERPSISVDPRYVTAQIQDNIYGGFLE